MDQAHSHDHDHDHHHDHDHDHNENLSELELKKKRWSAVDRFKSRKGRAPTKDELQQLLEHGHTHDHMENAGAFHSRDQRMKDRDFTQRSFTVGIGGPVGSGKTALMLALCRALRDEVSIAAVTNDIFTREDGEFLVNNEALPAERILAIETGGCPHAAIREDISANLQACEELTQKFKTDLVLIESGGDNLAANYSRELADYIIYVIDVAGGDKVPRKGGPGITQADLLIVNKIDLADAVGADLAVMKHDAALMRSGGPTVFTQVKKNDGKNDSVDEIVKHILQALQDAKSADVSVDVSTSSNKHARIC